MVSDSVNEERPRTPCLSVRKVEELLFYRIEAVVQDQVLDTRLGESQLVKFDSNLNGAILVHTLFELRNACSFSAISSIPPKNS